MEQIQRSYITLKEWAQQKGMTYFQAYNWYRDGFIPNAQKKKGRILVKTNLNNKKQHG